MKGRMLRRTPSLRSGSQPMGCSSMRLPAHEDVVGWLALQDRLQLGLQGLGGGQALVGAVLTPSASALLLADPVAEVGVDQRSPALAWSSLW